MPEGSAWKQCSEVVQLGGEGEESREEDGVVRSDAEGEAEWEAGGDGVDLSLLMGLPAASAGGLVEPWNQRPRPFIVRKKKRWGSGGRKGPKRTKASFLNNSLSQ